MFRAYFGDFTTGRLTRLPFLGYLLLLSVLFILYGLGIAFGLGVAEHLLRGDLSAAQGYLREHLGLPVITLLGPFLLAFGLAKWNLVAKRIRDMGLPGWRVLLVIVLADAGLALAMYTSGESMNHVSLVLWADQRHPLPRPAAHPQRVVCPPAASSRFPHPPSHCEPRRPRLALSHGAQPGLPSCLNASRPHTE